MEAVANIKCQLPHLNIEGCIILQKQEKMANIYVIIYITLIKLSYLHWETRNIQNSRLANPDNKNISIYKYDK